MLAYVFWHRARDGISGPEYERALRAFHDSVGVTSAAFRLAELPFGSGGGYEDWYLLEDWAALGALNAAAVSGERLPRHDAVAGLAAEGWGGVYALVRGPAVPPAATDWVAKPAGQSYGEFVESLEAASVWQRQLLLGPAPEFCLGRPPGARDPGRVAVA